MSGRLFNRGARLTIARLKGGSFFATDPAHNAIVVTALDMTFKIEKGLGKDPNTAEVVIYNMAPLTRAELNKKPLHVRLDVGYDGDLARIFTGDLTFASSKPENGVSWVTRLELGDGARAIGSARVGKTFRAGANAKDLIGEVAGAMGLKVPSSIADAKALVTQFSSGVTLSGPADGAMTKILDKHNYGWSVQDGALQILPPGGVRADEAILISQRTGMIGSPDYGTPKKAGEAPELKVQVQLQPGLTPGARILVEASEVKGLFRIQKVTHVGNTKAGDWYSEIEAKPI